MEDYANIIGFTAGILTASATLPQILRIWKMRSADEISYKTFSIISLGVFLWVVYGILVDDVTIVWMNALSLLLNGTVLFSKWRFSSGQRRDQFPNGLRRHLEL